MKNNKTKRFDLVWIGEDNGGRNEMGDCTLSCLTLQGIMAFAEWHNLTDDNYQVEEISGPENNEQVIATHKINY